MATELWAILLVIISSVLAAFSSILLKKASEKRLLHIKSLMTNYHLFGAVALYGLGISVFVVALKGGDLSVLYPLSSLGYVWASLGSIKFLGEKMNKSKWTGVILIIIGVTFIGIGSS